MKNEKPRVLIVGAGPAGLTAATELLKTNRCSVTIVERDESVGGLAKTVDYKGYKFDFGPHHFITSIPSIEAWWKEVMGCDFIKHKRFTRIYYKKNYFHYPLDALNVIRGLRLRECFHCVASYVWRQIFPIKNVVSFQDWITNKFGYRLFSIFFKTYTEKVWGIECHKISADWAAQRITGFSLSKAIFYAFFLRWFKKSAPRTLSDEFYYPLYGAGQLWDKVAQNFIGTAGAALALGETIIAIHHSKGKITSMVSAHKQNGTKEYVSDFFLSSMPLKVLVNALSPLPPQEVVDAANALSYRGLVTVNLILNKPTPFPDHWLYIHDKDVLMGRIGNMSNFSIHMMADPAHTSLSLEYFTFIEGELWRSSSTDLIALGTRELALLGIAHEHEVIDGMVQRASEAYPVYDQHYQRNVSLVRSYLASFSNLGLMGRNGLHRYNNMDLAMVSAFEAIKPIVEAISHEEHIRPSRGKSPEITL